MDMLTGYGVIAAMVLFFATAGALVEWWETTGALRRACPYKVIDANGQSLAYVYSRETPEAAQIAKVLTKDEARRIASGIAKLPNLLGKAS